MLCALYVQGICDRQREAGRGDQPSGVAVQRSSGEYEFNWQVRCVVHDKNTGDIRVMLYNPQLLVKSPTVAEFAEWQRATDSYVQSESVKKVDEQTRQAREAGRGSPAVDLSAIRNGLYREIGVDYEAIRPILGLEMTTQPKADINPESVNGRFVQGLIDEQRRAVERGHQPPQFVVERTSGEVERDWSITGVSEGRVIIQKRVGGELLEKKPTLAEFVGWQKRRMNLPTTQ